MIFNSALISKAEEILKLAKQKDLKIVCAESCTGGLLSALLTEVPGASEVIERGFVVYCNEAKSNILNVKQSTLEKFGAVSAEVASEMSRGALKNSRSNIAIAITGIAGPHGGSDQKPVGLVFIAICQDDKTVVQKFSFSGSRAEIREDALEEALAILDSKLSQR